ncbi:MAG: hypothetical protein K2W78_15180 [Xanthobacteraceae bacterium]|nr:hypothetical protein [Xanthobacteraceae bacterium]
MTTIIDELVVTLGLDPAKFNKGQREALDNFKRTQDEFVKGSQNVEISAARSVSTVGAFRTAAVELFAAFETAKGIGEFVANLTTANAALGRVSRSTGVSVTEINRWQQAAGIFNGDAGAMAESIKTLSDAFQGLKFGEISPIITTLRAISTAGGTAIDVSKGVNQSLIDIATNIEAIEKSHPGSSGYLLRKLPFDSGTIDLLMSGASNVRSVLQLVDQLGPATNRDTNAFGELQKRINLAKIAAESSGRHAGTPLAEQAVNTIDYLGTHTSEQLVNGAVDQFKAEYDKTGFFGAFWNLVSGKAGTSFGAGSPQPVTSLALRTPFTSQTDKEQFIRGEALRQGINPDVALAVAKSEGFGSYIGDQGSSFGAFQLHYGGLAPGGNKVPGLGELFTKETGLDARDRSTEREQIRWALSYAAKNGWGDWHGWRGTRFAGIGQSQQSSGGNTEITVNGGIHVQAGPQATGAQAGEAVRDALTRQTRTAQSNTGQQ